MKVFFSIPLLAVLALMFNQGALAEPSRVFFQETADIEAEGSLSVDIEYPFHGYGATAGLRAGAFGGVVLINSHADANGTRMGFSASSAGFKMIVKDNIAAYAVLSYTDDGTDSGTDLAIGAAYTVRSGTLTYNINPELISDEVQGNRGFNTTLFLKGSVLVPLTAVSLTKVAAIAEATLENNSALDSIINLGLRWVPRQDVTLDFILYSDRGNPGGGAADIERGVPGWIKANIRF